MQETRQNLLIGLFVLCGLAALGTLIVLFGQGPTALLGGEGMPLDIHFKSASGIRAGNQVTVGGIEVGRVRDVQFIDPRRYDVGVKVVVVIDTGYQIPHGSRAITTEPVLGQGRPPIEIIPGSANTFLAAGSSIPGEVRSALDAFLPRQILSTLDKTATHIGEAAAALTPVLEDLHEVLVKRGPGEVDRPGGLQGNLSSAAARFDSALKHFNEVLGDPQTQSQLKEAIANLHIMTEDGKVVFADLKAASQEVREVAGEAKALVADARSSLQRVEGEVAATARDFRSTLDRGSRLLDSIHEITAVINRGEGTIGRLVYDGKLYEALVLTAERLGQTVEEARLLIKDWQKGRVRVAF